MNYVFAPAMLLMAISSAPALSKESPFGDQSGYPSPLKLADSRSELQLLKPYSPNQDEVISIDHSRQKYIIGDEIPSEENLNLNLNRNEPTKVTSNPVDEAINREELRLWQWLRMGRYADMEYKIQELKALYPRWTPPRKMTQLLVEGKGRKKLQQAVELNQWDQIILLSQSAPELFTCGQYYNRWKLADAYAEQQNQAAVVQVYQQLMDECQSGKIRLDTFERSQVHLSYDELLVLLRQEEARKKHRLSKKSLASMKAMLARSEVLIASRNGDDHAVIAAIPALQDAVNREKNAGYALIFGWSLFRQDKADEAAVWFERAYKWEPSRESVQGLANMYSYQGRLEDAEKLARADLKDPLMREMLGEILAQKGRDAFDAEDYPSTIKYLDEATQYAPRTLNDEAVYGWASYHLGNFEAASAAFEKAYQDDPQPAIAEGLYYSLQETDESRLEDVAEEYEGPLKSMVDARSGEKAFDSRLYHVAYAEDPAKYPMLKGVNSSALLGGMIFHFRSGESGMSQLDTQKVPILTGEIDINRHLFELEVAAVTLSNGQLKESALVGNYTNPGSPYAFEPTVEVSNAPEMALRYRYEGTLSPYAEIGTTPSGGPVDSRMKGKLGATFGMKRGSINFEFFSLPVKESILSYVGIHDPYDGIPWGGVNKKGFSTMAFLTMNERFSTSVQIRSASYEGELVDTNEMLEFSLGARRYWTAEGWDEISAGPNFSFQRFDKNLSKYTLGHGGYFSPQQLFKFGGGAAATTEEFHSYIAGAKLDLGYQQHEEDCAPLRPQFSNACAPEYSSNSAAGVYLGVQLAAMVQADPHAQLGGGFFYSMSPEFNEFGFMLAFRLTLDPRNGTMKMDLPRWINQVHE